LSPDIILLTGDFVEYAPEPIEDLAQNYLGKLHSRFGVYAVLGNHDHKVEGAPQMIIRTLQSIGVK